MVTTMEAFLSPLWDSATDHILVCVFTFVLTWWCLLADKLTDPPDLLPVLFPSLPLLLSQAWPDGSQSILTEVSREVSASLSSFLSALFGVCTCDSEHLLFIPFPIIA